VTYVTITVRWAAISSESSGAVVLAAGNGGSASLGMPVPLYSSKQTPFVAQIKMASKFTHRQDSLWANTSICLKCFRVVATRERESELRGAEAVHSCKVSLPGMKPNPAYWAILCRTCAELVAFGAASGPDFCPRAEGSRPGTIRCSKGHAHIYFPRDFRLFPSPVTVADETMRENVRIYKAVNPSWEFTSESQPTESTPKSKNDSGIHVEGLNRTKMRPASLRADSPREIAHRAAKHRWASWALKKVQGLE
jgi:hypothetical protein